jgi:hypothetical protein
MLVAEQRAAVNKDSGRQTLALRRIAQLAEAA